MSNPDDDTDVHSGLNDDAEMERTSPRETPPPPPVLALSPTSCPTKAHQIQYARPIYGRAAALAAKQVKTG